ncbi:MAG TPA: GNAT family N-acetyltransferase, partial [Actinomycetota bacterium]
MTPPSRGRARSSASAARGGDASSTTVPRWLSPTAAPTHVLQTGPAAQAVPLPSCGASVAGPAKAISPARLHTFRCFPQSASRRLPPGPAGLASCNPGTSGRSSTEARYMSIYVAGDARGKGVGRALLRRLIDDSEEADIWT